jgi:hypothetical protein
VALVSTTVAHGPPQGCAPSWASPTSSGLRFVQNTLKVSGRQIGEACQRPQPPRHVAVGEHEHRHVRRDPPRRLRGRSRRRGRVVASPDPTPAARGGPPPRRPSGQAACGGRPRWRQPRSTRGPIGRYSAAAGWSCSSSPATPRSCGVRSPTCCPCCAGWPPTTRRRLRVDEILARVHCRQRRRRQRGTVTPGRCHRGCDRGLGARQRLACRPRWHQPPLVRPGLTSDATPGHVKTLGATYRTGHVRDAA